MAEKQYIVSLPRGISSELLSNLNYDVPCGIRNQIDYDYSGVRKTDKTFAATARDALSHVFYKDSNGVENPARLLRIFGPVSSKYAFEVPQRDKRDMNGKKLSKQSVDTFQEMELAMEMARGRNCAPEDCYGDARDLIKFTRGR